MGKSMHLVIETSEEARHSHITIRHILYLNNVIRMAKNQECITRYTDIARSRDISQVIMVSVCDSALYSTAKGYDQQ